MPSKFVWKRSFLMMQAILTILALSMKTSAFSNKQQSLTALLSIRGGASQLPSFNDNSNKHDHISKSQIKRKRKRKRRSSTNNDGAAAVTSPKNEVEKQQDCPQVVTIKKRIKSKKVSVTRNGQEVRREFSKGDHAKQKLNDMDGNEKKDRRRKAAPKKSKDGDNNSKVRKGKDGECLRRIKREWKDAVKLGIAYDWQKIQTVTVKGRSPSGRFPSNGEGEDENASDDNFYHYNYVRIGPYGKNLLRWHFSVTGPSNSVYMGGIYHGRILLPKDYPMSPPRVQMLTPTGRFIPGEDICLSASNYHPETWTPRWTILSLVDALRLHMLTSPNEIGGIDATQEKRARLSAESRSWKIGPIDHGKMAQSGLFCSKKEHDETADNEIEKQRGNERDRLFKLMSSTGEEFSVQRERVESSTKLAENITKRTLAQTVIIVAFKVLVAALKSPLRLGILVFAIFHFYIRPMYAK